MIGMCSFRLSRMYRPPVEVRMSFVRIDQAHGRAQDDQPSRRP